ncbi:helix-turn-helix domain-containing protein [Candidatus Omnitrophota bacterium]
MLAKNIKKLRKTHKLSQEQLAQRAGVTYSTLIKIESGANQNPTLETISKISEAFKISLDKLVKS